MKFPSGFLYSTNPTEKLAVPDVPIAFPPDATTLFCAKQKLTANNTKIKNEFFIQTIFMQIYSK
jgi:hypothetical protein